MQATVTGGAKNAVVLEDARMCHHCGYIGTDSLQTCTACKVQAHAQCVPFHRGTGDEGGDALLCSACYHGVPSAPGAPCCQLCFQQDRADAPPTATERLIRHVVYHGRTWVLVAEGEELVGAAVRLPADHAVAQAVVAHGPESYVCRDPHALPFAGQKPMWFLTDDGQQRVRSVPFVVHTWCAQCLFQQVIPGVVLPPDEVGTHWKALLGHVNDPGPVRLNGAQVGMLEKTGVRSANPCLFCGTTDGFVTFCYDHMNMPANDVRKGGGCTSCRWDAKPDTTLWNYHPACAVRHGMRRLIDLRGGGAGMWCQAAFEKCHHKFTGTLGRTAVQAHALQWLQGCSGFNRDVQEAYPIKQSTTHIVPDAPRFGGRSSKRKATCDASALPLPAAQKKRRAFTVIPELTEAQRQELARQVAPGDSAALASSHGAGAAPGVAAREENAAEAVQRGGGDQEAAGNDGNEEDGGGRRRDLTHGMDYHPHDGTDGAQDGGTNGTGSTVTMDDAEGRAAQYELMLWEQITATKALRRTVKQLQKEIKEVRDKCAQDLCKALANHPVPRPPCSDAGGTEIDYDRLAQHVVRHTANLMGR